MLYLGYVLSCYVLIVLIYNLIYNLEVSYLSIFT